MTRCLLPLVALLVFTFHTAFAQDLDFLTGLDPYRPQQPVTGTIRSRGNNYTIALMKLWEEGFLKHHPTVRFETTLNGSETAVAGLYGGIADVGFLGREIYQPENEAFEEWFGYKPLGIEVTTGSYDNPHKTFALDDLCSQGQSSLPAYDGTDRRHHWVRAYTGRQGTHAHLGPTRAHR